MPTKFASNEAKRYAFAPSNNINKGKKGKQ